MGRPPVFEPVSFAKSDSENPRSAFPVRNDPSATRLLWLDGLQAVSAKKRQNINIERIEQFPKKKERSERLTSLLHKIYTNFKLE
jgi:hypothetical protein